MSYNSALFNHRRNRDYYLEKAIAYSDNKGNYCESYKVEYRPSAQHGIVKEKPKIHKGLRVPRICRHSSGSAQSSSSGGG